MAREVEEQIKEKVMKKCIVCLGSKLILRQGKIITCTHCK